MNVFSQHGSETPSVKIVSIESHFAAQPKRRNHLFIKSCQWRLIAGLQTKFSQIQAHGNYHYNHAETSKNFIEKWKQIWTVIGWSFPDNRIDPKLDLKSKKYTIKKIAENKRLSTMKTDI